MAARKRRAGITPAAPPPPAQRDLVVLAADKQIQAGLRSLLDHRCASLGIALPNGFDIFLNPQQGFDSGCRVASAGFLRNFSKQYRHGLVVFDHEGSGSSTSAAEAESAVESELAQAGWDHRAAVVCIDPEFEAWAWTDSPQLEQLLNWQPTEMPLRQWLQGEGFVVTADGKPARPKEAFHAALERQHLPKSTNNFIQLAREVGLNRCQDRAFLRLRELLRRWFPATQ